MLTNRVALILTALTSIAILLSISQSASALVRLAAVGDIGCKDASIATLENLGESKLPLIGIGDYMYKCSPGDMVGDEGGTGGDDRLGDLYADIEHKVGAEGNHEAEKGQQEQWAEDTFKYPNDFAAWKLGDVGIIILNPYEDFKKGSDQYDFVVAKSMLFNANPKINWIVYVTHEPLYTPTVSGGHGANTALKDTYAPIIKKYGGFLLEAHNHITAFGTINNINIAMCGGAGYGGDTLGKLNGFSWATSKEFGYCDFTFMPNSIVAKMIGTDGNTVREHMFTR